MWPSSRPGPILGHFVFNVFFCARNELLKKQKKQTVFALSVSDLVLQPALERSRVEFSRKVGEFVFPNTCFFMAP